LITKRKYSEKILKTSSFDTNFTDKHYFGHQNKINATILREHTIKTERQRKKKLQFTLAFHSLIRNFVPVILGLGGAPQCGAEIIPMESEPGNTGVEN
jgi:hypothetical protein